MSKAKILRKIPLLSSLAVFLVALILLLVASQKDLEIASSSYNRLDKAAPYVSAIAALPGYLLFAMSGYMITSEINDEPSKIKDFLSVVPLIVISIGAGALYGYTSISRLISSIYLAVSIGIVLIVGLTMLFMWLYEKYGEKGPTGVGYVLLASFAMVFLFSFLSNLLVIRPSYKGLLEKENGSELFLDWWNFKSSDPEYLEKAGLDIVYLRGGISLDSSISALTLLLPLALPKKMKMKEAIGAASVFLFILLSSISELSDGRHYLSEIAWGLIIVSLLATPFLSNEKFYSGESIAMMAIGKGEKVRMHGENASAKALRLNLASSSEREMKMRRKYNSSRESISAFAPAKTPMKGRKRK